MKACSNLQDVAWLVPFSRPVAKECGVVWNVQLDIGFHRVELFSTVNRRFVTTWPWCCQSPSSWRFRSGQLLPAVHPQLAWAADELLGW